MKKVYDIAEGTQTVETDFGMINLEEDEPLFRYMPRKELRPQHISERVLKEVSQFPEFSSDEIHFENYPCFYALPKPSILRGLRYLKNKYQHINPSEQIAVSFESPRVSTLYSLNGIQFLFKNPTEITFPNPDPLLKPVFGKKKSSLERLEETVVDNARKNNAGLDLSLGDIVRMNARFTLDRTYKYRPGFLESRLFTEQDFDWNHRFSQSYEDAVENAYALITALGYIITGGLLGHGGPIKVLCQEDLRNSARDITCIERKLEFGETPLTVHATPLWMDKAHGVAEKITKKYNTTVPVQELVEN
jgi:hypothetical protein